MEFCKIFSEVERNTKISHELGYLLIFLDKPAKLENCQNKFDFFVKEAIVKLHSN